MVIRLSQLPVSRARAGRDANKAVQSMACSRCGSQSWRFAGKWRTTAIFTCANCGYNQEVAD